jgi:hypothetical protein
MSAKRKRLLALAKHHRKSNQMRRSRGVVSVVRHKRRPGQPLWSLSMRLQIPLPGKLKCECMRLARENRLSQAELGLLIVAAAVRDEAWLRRVLKARNGR